MIHRAMFCLAALVTLAATTAIAGLFDSTPSEANAEGYWRARFSNSSGLLQMTSFKKTDGKTTGDVYTLYYTLTYTVTDDCQYDADFKATRGLPQTEMERLAGMFEKNQGRKGQQIIQSGEMLYEKRESGWQLVHIENTRASESTATAEKRAAEEKAQQQKALREKEDRDERVTKLLCKAKEQHKIIKTVTVKGEPNPFEGAFARQAPVKITLSDCDITFENWERTDIVWFADIKRLYPSRDGKEYSLGIDGQSHMRSFFPSPEQLNDFCSVATATIQQWQKDNYSLFELWTPHTPEPATGTGSERIVGTWREGQETVTFRSDGTGNWVGSSGKDDFTWELLQNTVLTLTNTAKNDIPVTKKAKVDGRIDDFTNSEFKLRWNQANARLTRWTRMLNSNPPVAISTSVDVSRSNPQPDNNSRTPETDMSKRIIGTWRGGQETVTYNNDGTGSLIERRGRADFTWSIDGEALVITYTAFNGVPPEKKLVNRGRLTDVTDSEYKWVDYGGGKVYVWKRIKQ